MGDNEYWRDLNKELGKPSEQVFYEAIPAAPNGLGSQVGEWLWVGDWQQAGDFMRWTRKRTPYSDGVARVVTCAAESPVNGDYVFPLVDGPSEGNARIFWEAVNKVLYLRGLKHRPLTFVHCMAGLSRAPAVVIGSMMIAREIGYSQALAEMKSVRPAVNLHPFFEMQLKSYDRMRAVRQSLSPRRI